MVWNAGQPQVDLSGASLSEAKTCDCRPTRWREAQRADQVGGIEVPLTEQNTEEVL